MRLRSVVQLIRSFRISRSGSSVSYLILTIPVIANVARALSLGWFPTYDVGFLQLRAFDVGTRRTPLVGMPSTLSDVSGTTSFHPGPLQSWLSALPVRVFSFTPVTLLLTQAMLNVAWIVIAIHALRRSDWSRHRIKVLVIALVFLASLGPEVVHDPWNPHAAVIPLAVAILAASLVVLGQSSIAWVAVLAGSFAAQCHLSFAVAGAITVLVALVGSTREAIHDAPSARRNAWLTWSVFAACWIGPVLDQFFGHGNLGNLFGGGGGEVLGPTEAWSRFVRVLLPWRLLFDVRISPETLVSSVSWWESALAVVVLVGTTYSVARRTGRVRRLGVLILTLVFGQIVITALMPVTLGTVFGLHLMRAWWPIIFAFWILGLSLLAGKWTRSVDSFSRQPFSLSVLGASAVVTTVVAASYGLGDVRDGHWYRPTANVAAALERATSVGRYDFRTVGFDFESPLAVGVVSDLVRRGYEILVDAIVTPGLLSESRIAVNGQSTSVITVVMKRDDELVEIPDGELLFSRSFTVHEREDVVVEISAYISGADLS